MRELFHVECQASDGIWHVLSSEPFTDEASAQKHIDTTCLGFLRGDKSYLERFRVRKFVPLRYEIYDANGQQRGHFHAYEFENVVVSPFEAIQINRSDYATEESALKERREENVK